ncbi:hypothetical protein HK097_011669 [Rhizophlyctis rosea]|uniref:t-SNARE coiled-coil homology domain-containing protein n=1 Tax=Rhizophlyctis rosea TaxID=64517 RepID=A0AAD5SI95_9FUNG|nr:hypothetical protein HK097_011669 [Rhizophlyctis rosea]
MANDIERASASSGWDSEHFSLKSLSDDTLASILERKRAFKVGLGVEEYDKRIRANLSLVKSGIAKLETELSRAEEAGGRDAAELRRWEEAILELSKQYDRLEFMARGEDDDISSARKELFTPPKPSPNSSRTFKGKNQSVRFQDEEQPSDNADLDSGELMTLQQRIMDDQDAHLDLLAESISRQKQLGMQIGEELDLHVDLLEETDARVDSTTRRLQSAGRRLGEVTKAAASSNRGSTAICGLFILLLIIIILAKKL